jgi:hypothetical protein
MIYNIFNRSVLLVIFVLTVLSCEKKDGVLPDTDSPGLRKTATVMWEGDPASGGCGCLLLMEEKLYYPVNLHEQYKIDALQIEVSYKELNTFHSCGLDSQSYPVIHLETVQHVQGSACIHPGYVRDYTGLDGCTFIIELDNGIRLEPVEIVPDFVLKDGQRILCAYTEIPLGSICMVGKTVRMDCIEEIFCDSVKIQPANNYFIHNDEIHSLQYEIKASCLELTFSYSGGCKKQITELIIRPNWHLGYGPRNAPVLILSHNKNGDLCEALITETRSFDLSILENPNSDQVVFYLQANLNGKLYEERILYKY